MWAITSENCEEYLKSVAFLEGRRLRRIYSLGGGVSNEVLKIETDAGDSVLKQALARLRVKDEWLADISRIERERDALRLVGELFAGRHVPRVMFSDDENHVLIISCAPDSARMWKKDLLTGTVDTTIAARLGELLARIHLATSTDDEARRLFASHQAFDQLRIDPYYRTTARRHPDLASFFAPAIEQALTVKHCLVHGDYSPKNILVDCARGSEPIILDFEVVHYGDPTFDTAFFLNHLYIKSLYLAEKKREFFEAACCFWNAYQVGVRQTEWRDLEARTMRHLGCLMLARMDGKSPVEYVEEGPRKECIRRVARTIIQKEPSTLAELEKLIDED